MLRSRFMGVLRDPEPGAGGGGGGTPPPLTKDDIVKIVAAEVGKQITVAVKPLGDTLASITTTLAELKPKTEPPPEPKPGDKKPAAGDPDLVTRLQETERTLKALEKQVKDSDAARQRAELEAKETRKESEIRRLLSDFKFANPATAEDVFESLSNKLSFDDSGALVGKSKDGPVRADHFVKSFVEARPNVLAPVPTGGAGAGKGTPPSAGGVQIESIRPGMSEAERTAAYAAIAEAYKQ